MFKHMLTLIWNKKKKNSLLFVEIFFCFLIVFAISTFAIRNFRDYLSPYGYETEDLWHTSLYRPMMDIDSSAMVQTRETLKRELESIDGVEAVAFGGMSVPFSGSMWSNGGDEMGFDIWTTTLRGDADYNEVYGIELSQGRWYTPEDTLGKYRPVVISQSLVDEYWPGVSMVDSIFLMNDDEWIITGVMEHFRYRDGFEEELPVVVFYGEEDHHEDMHELYIRVAGNQAGALEERVVSRIGQLLKTEDIVINDLEENRKRMALQTWILIVIFLTIGGFLIFNIALGLFGVLFYTISKRRPEIGIRRAMGATGSQISKQFTLEVYLVAVAAMLLAAVFAVQVPLLGLMGDGLVPKDAYWGMVTAFVLISIVVLICAYAPSRSAARLHPAEVLHEN